MSYKKYNWEVAAHDYNSPYLRNHLWTNSILKYPKLLDVSNPILGIASYNNQIQYIGDMASWARTHEELKAKISQDYNLLDDLINKTLAWGESFNRWTEKNIFDIDLSLLSNKKLLALLKEFISGQEDGYTYGTALPTLDFLDFSFVEGNLNRFLKAKLPESKLAGCYAVFTAPIHNSFAQDQEEGLLNLMVSYYSDKQWRRDVLNKDLVALKNKYPKFFKQLLKHTEKYAWVYYVYMGPAFSIEDFYGFVKDYLRKRINPASKLLELKKNKKILEVAKSKYLKELKPSGLDAFILRIAGKVVWAKPRRKDYQSKSYYHLEKLLKEIANRLFISLDQVRSLPTETIAKALAGKKVDLAVANEIKKIHVCLPAGKKVVDLFGKEAKYFCNSVLKKSKQVIKNKPSELRGASACPGHAIGLAKIINVPSEMGKMEYGDILVSSGTTPSIVPAMKKAAAIITDEGGLTCHASIVSRELNIPCVVALKIITQIVQDGDQLEVDATKGIVKIIKRA